MNAINHARNPVRITLDELGRGIHGLGLGEQSIDLVDAISCVVSQEGLLQTASTLSIGENLFHIGMRQNIALHHLILVKNIVLHIIILLIIFIIFISLASAFQSLANQCINYSLLLFSQSIKDIFNSLITFRLIRLFHLLGIFHGVILLHFFIIGMRQRDVLASIDNSFFFGFLTMTDDGINECARVCTSQNEANFTNGPMNYISTVLLQLVCIDGQCRNIAMFN